MLVQTQVDLTPLNTFHISAVAAYFVRFQSVEQLVALLQYARVKGMDKQLVLGGGSNILLTGDYDGLVLKNEIAGIGLSGEDDEHVYITAGAGENWHQFVMHCVNENYAGLENLALIPGSVGASPMQNIGAYGVEVKDVFHSLQAYHKEEHFLRTFTREECGFGYRESVFKNQYRDQFIITSVCYRLRKKPAFNTSYGAIQQELERMGIEELTIRAVAQAVINIRTAKLPDPAETGNAGSFFKNPVVDNHQYFQLKESFPDIVAFPAGEQHTKLAAGWLIEQCGWKGFRKGDAGCYPRQALVLVNYGSAAGAEILELSERIIRSVQEKFNVKLQREVNII